MKTVSFCDVVNGYIYVLFGFFAHLYIIFSSSVYFSLVNTEAFLGSAISKETLITYFALLSIIVLVFSLYNKWTWPVKVEELLIVFFVWILLRNLLPKDCACCNPPPPTPESMGIHIDGEAPTPAPIPGSTNQEEGVVTTIAAKPPEDCTSWQNSGLLYSILCVIVMISSFMMNSRNNIVSLTFTVMTIVLVIFTTLIPVSCNQLNMANVNTHLIKFTLYSIVWFLNRRMRLSECVLSLLYLKSMRILYSYEDTHQRHLLCGVTHNKLRKVYKGTSQQQNRHCHDECDEIDYFINECTNNGEATLIPGSLFDKLELLCSSVIRQKNPKASSRHYRDIVSEQAKAGHYASQIRSVKKIHEIHREHDYFFSWKHRLYDPEIQNIFDLSKTLWILNVCPIFLLFVLLEYFLLNYRIHWNIKELKCLLRHVKVMRRVQRDSISITNQRKL